MQEASSIQKPARFGVWIAPLIAILWIAALLASLALLGYCWNLFRAAWHIS